MEETSNKIFEQLNISEELKEWDNINKYGLITEKTKVIEKGEPLFVRLDKEEEIEYIKEQMKK